ncbi:MAG: BRO-N domain-containing protein [Paraclostridium sp.]
MELSVIRTEVVLGKELRIFGDIDNPLFLAKDIADCIEHTNTAKMLNIVGGSKECISGTVLTGGGRQKMKLITEKQVYRILMRSDKKIAEQTLDFIFELIGNWRKSDIEVVQNNVTLEQSLTTRIYNGGVDAISAHKELLELKTKQLLVEIKNKENKINEDAKKVELYDFMDSSNWLNGEDITKMIAIKGLTENKMYCWLRYRGHFTKKNIPSAAMVEAKMCKLSPTSKKDFHGNVIQRPVFSMDFLQQIIKLHKDGKLNIEEAIKYEKDEKERNKKRYNEDIIFSI